MDLHSIKERIDEKLEAANEFSEMAVEIKTTNPHLSRKLMEMADTDLKHAECLEQVANEIYGIKAMEHGDRSEWGEYDDIHKDFAKRYSEAKTNVRNMRDLYARRDSRGRYSR